MGKKQDKSLLNRCDRKGPGGLCEHMLTQKQTRATRNRWSLSLLLLDNTVGRSGSSSSCSNNNTHNIMTDYKKKTDEIEESYFYLYLLLGLFLMLMRCVLLLLLR
jgi:hypothetical protein